MNLNFKQSALDFVRENNCANSAPIELIQKAMEYGASEAIKIASCRIKEARIDLELFRANNLRG